MAKKWHEKRVALLNGTCATPCPCGIPKTAHLRSLPFENVKQAHYYLNPGEVPTASTLLLS
jgi:hypothetical protein